MKMRRPGPPSSAATVTGVLCDALCFGFLCSRFEYACSKPPRPTPCEGCASAILIPTAIRVARPLVAWLRPEVVWWRNARIRCGWATAIPAATTRTAASANSDFQRQAIAASAKTATERRPTADDQHSRREYRDHEKAPVDRRVIENGVHSEQGSVDVALVQHRVLEDGLRLVLVEAGDGEDEGHRHELRVKDPDA